VRWPPCWGSEPETVCKWVRRAQIDAGARPGVTSEESDQIERLRREDFELRRANEILKAASTFFAAELDRPQRFSWCSLSPTRRRLGSCRSAAC
jgi:transposase-like protein